MKKKAIISVICAVIICVCLFFLIFGVFYYCVMGTVVKTTDAIDDQQRDRILIEISKPTLFWLDPSRDRVWLYVDDSSYFSEGDVVFAYSEGVMLQSDPPKVGTKWIWRIVDK